MHGSGLNVALYAIDSLSSNHGSGVEFVDLPAGSNNKFVFGVFVVK